MARTYKHCVIGHGLMGTAACKYLAEEGEDVVLVGPAEGDGVHGACYDEGRIYRILDPLKSWALLAQKSIAQYTNIAAESGIDFFHESGVLIFGVEDDFIRQTQQVAAKMHTNLLHLTPEQISVRYPWLTVPAATQLGLFQECNAGHMSPRKLNQAQLALAQRRGAAHINMEVDEVIQSSNGTFKVKTSDGKEVLANNVLVAAGCYTALLPLLPEQVVVSLTGAQALLVEISEEDATRMAKMPSMIYEGETDEDSVYLLPPIQYPDGAWLVKIGPSTAFAPPLRSAAEVDAWFRRGTLDPAFEAKAQALFRELFPNIHVIGSRPLLCVTDQTPTMNAYIDCLGPGWGVCSGGNGWAAKSSDAIGHLAAQMMSLPRHWGPDPSLPKEWFRAVTPHDLLPTPQLETALARVEACGEVMVCKALEALHVVTSLLASAPRLRLSSQRLVTALQAQLANCWNGEPSVLCLPTGGAWASGHPFITVHVEPFDVVVILRG